MKIAAIVASSAALGQISLGAIVIIERLHALLVTVHLGLGLLLFSMTLITALYARKITDIQFRDNKVSTNSSSIRPNAKHG
jgi:cytochrome c oxidase assembly protein subunit 15